MVRTILAEHDEQVRLVRWFRRKFKTIIFAIPNGGSRDRVTAGRLKEEGVLAGVPDLCIPEWRVYIEMKRKDGVLSAAQKQIQKELVGYGYIYLEAYGAEHAKELILAFVESKTLLGKVPEKAGAVQ